MNGKKINENKNNENIDNNEYDKDKLDKYSLLILFIEKEIVNKLLSYQIISNEINFSLLKDKLSDMFNNINNILNLLFDLNYEFFIYKKYNCKYLDLKEKLVKQIQNNNQKIKFK